MNVLTMNECCKRKLDETYLVIYAIKNEINFEKISDVNFNKYLKLGDFLLFSRLDDSRVI